MLWTQLFLLVDVFSLTGARNLKSQLQSSVDCLRVQVEPILTFIEAANDSGVVRQVRERLASWERQYMHSLKLVAPDQNSTPLGMTKSAEAFPARATVAATENQPASSASPVSPIMSLSNAPLLAPSSATYTQPTVPGTNPLVTTNPALDASSPGMTVFEDILKGSPTFQPL